MSTFQCEENYGLGVFIETRSSHASFVRTMFIAVPPSQVLVRTGYDSHLEQGKYSFSHYRAMQLPMNYRLGMHVVRKFSEDRA